MTFLLCMTIVGGAFVPLLFAQVADATGSRFTAFLVPVACYLLIPFFGWHASRTVMTHPVGSAPAAVH